MPYSESQTQRAAGGTLFIVATPIGNLKDITLRALETLKEADLIACEDTRVTRVLLSHYDIRTKTIAYHDHNGEKQRPVILEALEAGKNVALVSDAGTPLISDPGYKLVREAVDAGFTVTPIPGASSVLSALCIAGLPSDQFLFAGFLPAKNGAREKQLQSLKSVPATLVFFESGPRLAGSLASMAKVLGPRPTAVTRELTKRFEEARRNTLDNLAVYYDSHGAPKGEIVIVVGPPDEQETPSDEQIDQFLRTALETLSVKEAAAMVAEETGLSKRELYNRALDMQKKK